MGKLHVFIDSLCILQNVTVALLLVVVLFCNVQGAPKNNNSLGKILYLWNYGRLFPPNLEH